MDNEQTLSFIRKRIFFYLGFLVLIFLGLILIRPFFTTIIISLMSVVLLKPLYNFLLRPKFVKQHVSIAVALTLLSFLLIIVIPLFIIVQMTTTQISAAFNEMGSQEIDPLLQDLEMIFGDTGLSRGTIEGTASIVQSFKTVILAIGVGFTGWILDLIVSIPSLIVHLIIFLAVVASMLPVFDDVLELSQQVSPIGYELGAIYNRKITAMVKSLVTGVFLIAVIQGLAMGVVYWIAGLDYLFLLVMISIMMAIIPMVGISWLVIAMAIISLIGGNPTQAIIVLVGFYGFVNWIDVVLRPKFISQEAHLHTTLFLISIFGGLAWAGFMGLFYGPIIMLLLVTTVEIYIEEFAREDGRRIGSAVSSRMGGDEEQ